MENYSLSFGFVTAKIFFAMVMCGTIGIIISLLLHSLTRDKKSPRTPEKYSFWFLLKDNWKSIVVTALIFLMTLRFATSFFPSQFKSADTLTAEGIDRWLFFSLLLGTGFNQLIQVWKKRSDWLKVK